MVLPLALHNTKYLGGNEKLPCAHTPLLAIVLAGYCALQGRSSLQQVRLRCWAGRQISLYWIACWFSSSASPLAVLTLPLPLHFGSIYYMIGTRS